MLPVQPVMSLKNLPMAIIPNINGRMKMGRKPIHMYHILQMPWERSPRNRNRKNGLARISSVKKTTACSAVAQAGLMWSYYSGLGSLILLMATSAARDITSKTSLTGGQ